MACIEIQYVIVSARHSLYPGSEQYFDATSNNMSDHIITDRYVVTVYELVIIIIVDHRAR